MFVNREIFRQSKIKWWVEEVVEQDCTYMSEGTVINSIFRNKCSLWINEGKMRPSTWISDGIKLICFSIQLLPYFLANLDYIRVRCWKIPCREYFTFLNMFHFEIFFFRNFFVFLCTTMLNTSRHVISILRSEAREGFIPLKERCAEWRKMKGFIQ